MEEKGQKENKKRGSNISASLMCPSVCVWVLGSFFQAALALVRLRYPSGYPCCGNGLVLCQLHRVGAHDGRATSCSPTVLLCAGSCSQFLVQVSDVTPQYLFSFSKHVLEYRVGGATCYSANSVPAPASGIFQFQPLLDILSWCAASLWHWQNPSHGASSPWDQSHHDTPEARSWTCEVELSLPRKETSTGRQCQRVLNAGVKSWLLDLWMGFWPCLGRIF